MAVCDVAQTHLLQCLIMIVVFSDIFTLNAVSVIKEHFSYSRDKSDSFFSFFYVTCEHKSMRYFLLSESPEKFSLSKRPVT